VQHRRRGTTTAAAAAAAASTRVAASSCRPAAARRLQLGALAARWRCPMPAALSLVLPTSCKCRQSSDLELLALQQMRQSQAPILCTHHTASFASGAVQLALPTATLTRYPPRGPCSAKAGPHPPCPTAGPALASPKRAAGFGSQQLGHACFSSRAAPRALSWFASGPRPLRELATRPLQKTAQLTGHPIFDHLGAVL